jgi:hypothetical protein
MEGEWQEAARGAHRRRYPWCKARPCILDTGGLFPEEGYLVAAEQGNHEDLLVLLEDGTLWTVFGPLSPNQVVYLK